MEAKKTRAKKVTVDDNSIISKYMDYVLEKNCEPINLYNFCKDTKIDETDFYTFFNSIDDLKQEIWVKFFENVQAIITKDDTFKNYTDKNKLLTLYFTLFETITLNRSYVVFSLTENKDKLQNLNSLKKFRNHFKSFINESIISQTTIINEKINKITTPVYSEGAWIQFLLLLKFWLNDTSKSFEKTDILIEKSVNTVVDLLDTKPLESLFDLGKFLWKEKMN